eukprot:TRINITY_DN2403_c0_g2_i1.p1 TRINITY_DN2403_c0_g2~~TRINITY_DN2403_c0_g2_i1.p1  ORF type:complete len:278 (-),score=100.84 TRINITY_DN2403_c0_g2_i1:125-856(-)
MSYGYAEQGYTNSYGGESSYRAYFDQGDLSRTGHLDATGMQNALRAAGEGEIDYETIQTMIQMADADGSGTIDFQEFCGLMDSVNELKSNYSASGSGMATRDVESYMSGQVGDQERGLLPTMMPTNQNFFTFGNFIKLAFVVGIGRKIYDHRMKNRPAGSGNFITNHLPAAFGGKRDTTAMSSAPGSYPVGYAQPSMAPQPAYGQAAAYGQPAYGQPAYGQPAYGQPAAPYGQQNSYGAPNYY